MLQKKTFLLFCNWRKISGRKVIHRWTKKTIVPILFCVVCFQKPVVTQPLTPVQKLMICRKNGIFLTNGTCICNPGFDGKYCQLQIAQPKMSSSALVLCPCLVLCIFTLLNYYYTILFGTTVV